MTLDLKKYIENLIKKEAKISHFSVKVSAGKTEKIKGKFAAAIKSSYGELFLNDANYVLFFTRPEGWSDKDTQKAFELTDRALGKDANKLSKADFKKLDLGSASVSDDTDNDLDDEMSEELTSVQDDNVETLFVKVTIK